MINEKDFTEKFFTDELCPRIKVYPNELWEWITQNFAPKDSSQLEPQVGKLLISELRKHYLVEIDIDTGEPKADMKTLMELWNKVNKYLEIKTVG